MKTKQEYQKAKDQKITTREDPENSEKAVAGHILQGDLSNTSPQKITDIVNQYIPMMHTTHRNSNQISKEEVEKSQP
ncbi:hypothetical protein [Enterococcus faecium]|uniref:hypothetical protein n=1 Tax=Enterococcus faecium TaxID=1352 RepID=UPI0013B05B13|nr:hypothetical protein [Enterococcus faecium]